MELRNTINNMTEWLLAEKQHRRWTFTELADITGYSISGVKKALRESTLRYDAIVKIVKAKNIEHIFNEKFSTYSTEVQKGAIESIGHKKSQNLKIEDLAIRVIENWDELLKDKFFKLQIENYSLGKALEMLKNNSVD